jgi:hypothetical protein
MLAANTKRGYLSYIDHFFFHLYEHGNMLLNKEETQWTGYQIMRELHTTHSEPKMGQKYSK